MGGIITQVSAKTYPDETVDDLLYGELKLIQKKKGNRYSVDALLLADFVLPLIKPKHKILDLGCGNGVIALILAKRSKAHITGVEIQAGLAGTAKRNVQLNGLEKKVAVLRADARKLEQSLQPESFDIMVSNPPFRKVGMGLISSNKERAIARYELKLTMQECLKAASALVKSKGKIFLVYPNERYNELVRELNCSGLYPARIRFAYHKQGDPKPILFCLEARKTPVDVIMQAPWFIETEKGRFHIDRDK
jgi:tRNA1Val (adenine37-N6)-methyltransferase